MAEEDQGSQFSNAQNVAKFLFLRSLLNGGQAQQQPQQQQSAFGLGGLLGLLGGRFSNQGQKLGTFGRARQNFLGGGGQERDIPRRFIMSTGGRSKPIPNPEFRRFLGQNADPNDDIDRPSGLRDLFF